MPLIKNMMMKLTPNILTPFLNSVVDLIRFSQQFFFVIVIGGIMIPHKVHVSISRTANMLVYVAKGILLM